VKHEIGRFRMKAFSTLFISRILRRYSLIEHRHGMGHVFGRLSHHGILRLQALCEEFKILAIHDVSWSSVGVHDFRVVRNPLSKAPSKVAIEGIVIVEPGGSRMPASDGIRILKSYAKQKRLVIIVITTTTTTTAIMMRRLLLSGAIVRCDIKMLDAF
jgi:hypothetical protein